MKLYKSMIMVLIGLVFVIIGMIVSSAIPLLIAAPFIFGSYLLALKK